jgi:hypothetical protein
MLSNITARVSGEDGQGLPGVTISAAGGEQGFSDSRGVDTLPGLGAGTCHLTPGKTGYAFTPAHRTLCAPPVVSGVDSAGLLLPDPIDPVCFPDLARQGELPPACLQICNGIDRYDKLDLIYTIDAAGRAANSGRRRGMQVGACQAGQPAWDGTRGYRAHTRWLECVNGRAQ